MMQCEMKKTIRTNQKTYTELAGHVVIALLGSVNNKKKQSLTAQQQQQQRYQHQ